MKLGHMATVLLFLFVITGVLAPTAYAIVCPVSVGATCGSGPGPGGKAPGTYPRSDRVPWIVVNGELINFDWDMQPYVDPVTNRTYISVRGIGEALGLVTDWDEDYRMVSVYDNQHMLNFTLGSDVKYYDGVPSHMEYPIQVRHDRSYFPLIEFLEAWGMAYFYQASNHAVYINFTADHETRTRGFSDWKARIIASCRLHGYHVEENDFGDCPANAFFYPTFYSSFGSEIAIILIQSGASNDAGVVGYLNFISASHKGARTRTVQEAATETAIQVATDIFIAELIGLVWRPAPPNEAGTPPRSLQAQGAAAPTRTGWANPNGGRAMSEHAARWQAEVSGRAPELIKQGTGNTHTWNIQEYGIVTSRGSLWMDAADVTNKIAIDAKYINPKWLRGSVFNKFISDRVMKQFAEEARRQMHILGDDWVLQWRFSSQAGLDAFVKWLQNNGGQDILARVLLTR